MTGLLTPISPTNTAFRLDTKSVTATCEGL